MFSTRLGDAFIISTYFPVILGQLSPLKNCLLLVFADLSTSINSNRVTYEICCCYFNK